MTTGAGRGRRVVVVGGGLAGGAAATVLAERGAAVTLVEREPRLGGRLAAWPDRLADGTPVTMERGFHAFFRHYHNVRALLVRVDPGLRGLVPLADYPLVGPDGAVESFAGLPRRTPWNLLALVRRTPRLRLADLRRVDARLALEMLAYDPARTHAAFGDLSAREYLDGLGFPPDARRMLFDVFAHSFFNPEEELAAAELIEMFHFYFFGNREGLVFDVLARPFSAALWDPLARRLAEAGACLRLGTAARGVERDGERWAVRLDGDEALAADAVVLALDVGALRELIRRSPTLDDPAWRASIDALRTTRPFAVWRLWLDRRAAPGRAPFVGTAGLGALDNVSLYERFQDEARAWSARTGGAVVELHAYALPERVDEAALRADLRAGLDAVYPELAGARVLDERWLVRRDCPAFPPGASAGRPTVETPWPALALAGDGIRVPFPAALMERAVATGFLAANRIAARWGAAPEPIRTAPARGLLARWIGQRGPGGSTSRGGAQAASPRARSA